MYGQVVDSRDLAIFFNNKVFRNPFTNVWKKIMEYFTEEALTVKFVVFQPPAYYPGPAGQYDHNLPLLWGQGMEKTQAEAFL